MVPAVAVAAQPSSVERNMMERRAMHTRGLGGTFWMFSKFVNGELKDSVTGGITVTNEPLTSFPFTAGCDERQCHEECVHVAMDTKGNSQWQWRRVDKFLALVSSGVET